MRYKTNPNYGSSFSISLFAVVFLFCRCGESNKVCIDDGRATRNMMASPGTYDPSSLSPNECRLVCAEQNHNQSGILDSSLCLCSDGFVSDHLYNCSSLIMCRDGVSQECGTAGSIALLPSLTLLEDITVTLSDISTIVQYGDEVNITVAASGGYDPVLSTGLFEEGHEPEIIVAETNTYNTMRILKLGKVNLDFELTDTFDGHVTTKSYFHTMEMHSFAADVHVMCPAVVVFNTSFQCSVSIGEGTSFDITTDWDEGHQHTMQSIDTTIFTSGKQRENFHTKSKKFTERGVVLMPDYMFRYDGRVTGLRGIIPSGREITIQLYKPYCNASHQLVFCFKSMSCIHEGLDCYKQPTFSQHTCTQGSMYGIAKKQCLYPNGSAVAEESRFHAFNVTDFLLVDQTEVNASHVDRVFYHKFTNPLTVMRGYIPAMYYRDSTLVYAGLSEGVEIIFDTHDFKRQETVLSSTEGVISLKASHFEFTVTRPALVMTPEYRYEKTSGTFNVTINVTSTKLEATRLASNSIRVQQMIDGLRMVAADIGRTFLSYTVTVPEHEGSDVQYQLNWGDGTSSSNFKGVISHVYMQPGVMNVTLKASNNVSEQLVMKNVTVADQMEGLEATFDNSPALVLGETAFIRVYLSRGTDAQISVYDSDGVNQTGYFTLVDLEDNPLSIHQKYFNEAKGRGTVLSPLANSSVSADGNGTALCTKMCLSQTSPLCRSVQIKAASTPGGMSTCYFLSEPVLSHTADLRTDENSTLFNLRPTCGSSVWKSKAFILSPDCIQPLNVTDMAWDVDSAPLFTLNASSNESLKIELPTLGFVYNLIITGDGHSSWMETFEIFSSTDDNRSLVSQGIMNGNQDANSRVIVSSYFLAKNLLIKPVSFQGALNFTFDVSACNACYKEYVAEIEQLPEGNNTVSIMARNQWNNLTLDIEIPVQNEIERFTIHPLATVTFGDFINVSVTVSNGSDITMSAKLNDSIDVQPVQESTFEWSIRISPDVYMTIGQHNLTVNADNLVSDPVQGVITVWVDYPLVNVTVNASTHVTATFTDVDFDISMHHGSRFTCNIDYGDSNETLYTDLVVAPASVGINHAFSYDGVFDVEIICQNDVSSSRNQVTIIAQNVIGEMNMVDDRCVPLANNGTGEGRFYVVYDGNDTHVPSNVTFSITDGRHFSASEIIAFNSTQPAGFINNYTEYGTLNVTVHAHNLVSNMTWTSVTDVDREIIGLDVSCINRKVRVGDVVNITATLTWGTRIQFIWQFMDGNNHTEFKENDTVSTVQHHFLNPGQFRVNVTAANCAGYISDVLQEFEEVVVEYPIEGLDVIGTQEILLPFPEQVVLSHIHLLINASVNMPTDVSCVIDFDDGSPVVERHRIMSPNITVSHNYTTHGTFNINTTCWNNVSTINRRYTQLVYLEITGLRSHDVFNIDGKDMRGYGPDKNFYASKYPIQMVSNQTSGSDLTCWWDFGDKSNPTLQTGYVTIYTYSSPGTYLVHLNCSNPLVSRNFSRSLTIQDTVIATQAFCTGALPRGVSHPFSVQFESVGTDVCYVIEFTDGNSRTRVLGNENECSRRYGSNIYNSTINLIGKTLFFNESFNALGRFDMKINISNIVSSESKSCKYGVTKGICKFPKIDIAVPNSCQMPFCDEDNVRTVYHSRLFVVYTEVELICWNMTTSYEWTILKHNPVSGEWENVTLPDGFVLRSNSLRTLQIPSHTLDYGLYEFSLNATMISEIGIWTEDKTRIRVIKTPLNAEMKGGPFKKKKFQTNVTLTAFGLSYDPDVSDSDLRTEGINYTFYCKHDCEEWPYMNGSLLVHPPNDCPVGQPAGCFVDGTHLPGELILTEEEHFVPYGSVSPGVLWVDSNSMIEGAMYDIRVVVTKDDRRSEFDQTLEIVQGDPPEIDIECIANKQKKIDPRSRFAARSVITNWNRYVKYTYSWDLLHADANKFTFRDHAKFAWDDRKWVNNASTGLTSSDFALDKDMFNSPALYGKTFHIRVSAYRGDNAINNGVAYYAFDINEPPTTSKHKCSFTPPDGKALETLFSLDCSGFEDVDIPFSYAFYVKANRAAKKTFLQSGERPLFHNVLLPPGLEQDGYRVYVTVRVYDSIGSYTDVEHSVKVDFDIKTLDDVKDFVFGEESLLQKNIVQMDIDSMVQLCAVVGDVCNRWTTTITNVTEVSKTLTTAIELIDECTDALFNHTNVDDMPDAVSLSSVGSKLTSNPNAVTNGTRKKLIAIQSKIVDFFNTATGVNVEEAVASLLQFQNNLIEAAKRYISTGEEEVLEIEQQIEELMTNIKNTSRIIVDGMVIGESPTTISSTGASYSVSKQFPDMLANSQMYGSDSSSRFTLPDSDDPLNQGNNNTYYNKFMVVQQNNNPFGFSSTSDSITTSVLSLEVKDEGDNTTDVNGLPDDKLIRIVIQQKNEKTPEPICAQTTPKLGEMKVFSGRVPAHASFAIDIAVNDCINETELYTANNSFNLNSSSVFSSPNSTIFVTNKTRTNATESSSTVLMTTGTVFDETTAPTPMNNQTHFVNTTERTSNSSLLQLASIANMTNQTNSEEPEGHVIFVIYVKKEGPPTETDYDFRCLVAPTLKEGNVSSTDTPGVSPNCFLDNQQLDIQKEPMGLFYGVRAFKSESTGKSLLNITEEDVDENNFIAVNYSVTVFSSSCLYYDRDRHDWLTTGIKVGKDSTLKETHCFTSHLTSFASSFYVPMNRIVPPSEAFSAASLAENPVCFLFGICVVCAYLIVVVWARWADVKDLEKLGVTPLPDNSPMDKYAYEVTLWTGFRKNAGTTARVSFIISGDLGETKPRLLWDDKRPILKRGAIDSFLITVPQSLGKLSHLRMWHDNSGKSPSWFFSRMMVHDVQTGQKYYYICDRWLAVEEDDGMIDRITPVAGREEMTSFNHLFWTKTRRNLSDGHLWFSVVNRPPRSTFTRVQRVTCCLSLLFCTMTANILFYGQDNNVESPQTINLGPIKFTLHSVYTGVISSLIAFPASLIIVTIFRYSGIRTTRKKHNVGKSETNQKKTPKEAISEDERPVTVMSLAAININELENEYMLGQHNELSRVMKTPPPGVYKSNFTGGLQPAYSEYRGESYKDENSKEKKKDKKFMLPWWFVIIGYMLSFGIVAGSFVIIVGVGAGFGKDKAEEWLAAMIVSFIESTFFTQPIKVFFLALVYALIIKSPDKDEDEEASPLANDEEYLHLAPSKNEGREYVHRLIGTSHASNSFMPPDNELLKEAREIRFKEIKMQSVIREIMLYVVFMFLLTMCAYSNQDPWMYGTRENMYNIFHDGKHDNQAQNNSSPFPMTKINSRENFWEWMTLTLVPALYHKSFYNGDEIDGNFTTDKNGFIMGIARLRQLRIAPDSCEVPRIVEEVITKCRSTYDLLTEDTGRYEPGWLPSNTSGEGNVTQNGWSFQKAIELDGYPYNGLLTLYGGGGFVANLGMDMETSLEIVEDLKKNNWIDMYTRAVFIEFVIYNANVNLHTISLSLVEFYNGGGAISFPHFHVMRLDRYVGGYMFFVMAVEILTGCFILFFTVTEIKKMMKMKRDYLKEAWNILEIIQVLLTMVTFILFVVRIIMAMRTSSNYRKHKDKFDNFQYTILWDELYSYFIGIVIFISTVKLLKLLRFNKKMSMLSLTVYTAMKPLANFMIVFAVIFLAYAQLAYLFFNTLLYDFHTFVTAVETLLVMLLNKFDFQSFVQASPRLGPVFFFLYTMVMSFILINMMLSIINEAFTTVKRDLSTQSNDYEIVDFMVKRFQQILGFGGAKKATLHKDREHVYYEEGEQDTLQTCEEFTDKVDTLLDKLTDIMVPMPNGTKQTSGGKHGNGDIQVEEALVMQYQLKRKLHKF